MINYQEGLLYVSKDEKDLLRRLFRRTEPEALYSLKGKAVGFHFRLNREALGKLKVRTK